MEQRISLVTLGVRDLERAKNFYVGGLGWQPSGCSTDAMVCFQVGVMAFALYCRADLAKDANVSDTESNFAGITLAYCVRQRAEVDAIMSKIEEIGGSILRPAQDVFWGGYSGYFSDPDGHPWEVAWNPFYIRPINEAGDIRLP